MSKETEIESTHMSAWMAKARKLGHFRGKLGERKKSLLMQIRQIKKRDARKNKNKEELMKISQFR